MAGSPCERVSRCREKAQRKKLALTQVSPCQTSLAGSSGPLCLADLPGPSSQPCPFQLQGPYGNLLVSRKRTRGRSLMDFPAGIAAANQRCRISVLHCNRFPNRDVPMPVTLPLDKARIEEMKEDYPGRSYYGGPTHECTYCGAAFWFQERVKGASNLSKRKIVYNLCCRGAKINLKPYKKPPIPLADLLGFDGDARSKRFLKQI